METLGIRNNNPANIRFSPLNKWKHQGKPNKGFCTFDSPVWGIRALLILIRQYRFLYGLDTIEKIISRFAPPSENNTGAYVLRVQGELCFPKDKTLYLDFHYFGEGSQLYELCYAICEVESGYLLDLETFRVALSLVDSLTFDAYQRFKRS